MPTHSDTVVECAAGCSPLRGCGLDPFADHCPQGRLTGTDFDRESLVHQPKTARRGGRVVRRRPLPEWFRNLGPGFPVVSGPHLVNHDSTPSPEGSSGGTASQPGCVHPFAGVAPSTNRRHVPVHSPSPNLLCRGLPLRHWSAYRSGSVADPGAAPVPEASRACHVRSNTRKST